MIPFLTEHFGNPASRSHAFGWKAEEAVEEARAHVAALVNCRPEGDRLDLGRDRVATTSRIKGAANSTRPRASTSSRMKTEHKAVLDTMRELERQGFEVTYLEVEPNGLVDLEQARRRRCARTRSWSRS